MKEKSLFSAIIVTKSLLVNQVLKFMKGFTLVKNHILAIHAINVSVNLVI
jgi:hypothetical protein